MKQKQVAIKKPRTKHKEKIIQLSKDKIGTIANISYNAAIDYYERKLKQLYELADGFIYKEPFDKVDPDCFRVNNPWTKSQEVPETIILKPISEGFLPSIEKGIEELEKSKALIISPKKVEACKKK